MTINKLPLFINGEFVESSSEKTLEVLNPATQEILCNVPCASLEEMTAAIEGAVDAFETWKETTKEDRL